MRKLIIVIIAMILIESSITAAIPFHDAKAFIQRVSLLAYELKMLERKIPIFES